MKNFYSLFIEEIKNIYDAEKQILKALPEMAKSAHSQNLKDALHQHLKETRDQIKRLETISKELNEDIEGAQNIIIKSMLTEGHKLIKAQLNPIVRDAALLNAAQHVEHYEIAS